MLCSIFVFYACPIHTERLQESAFLIENGTSYPLVLSLEFSDKWNDYKHHSEYLVTNSQIRYSRVEIESKYGFGRMRLDSVMLFNLRDTTAITWQAVCLDWGCSSYFGHLFTQQEAPPWEMSGTDSTKWYISKRAWTMDYRVPEIPTRKLTIAWELLDIMEKNYAMLGRFSEHYK
jgi:hypothetical protein